MVKYEVFINQVWNEKHLLNNDTFFLTKGLKRKEEQSYFLFTELVPLIKLYQHILLQTATYKSLFATNNYKVTPHDVSLRVPRVSIITMVIYYQNLVYFRQS